MKQVTLLSMLVFMAAGLLASAPALAGNTGGKKDEPSSQHEHRHEHFKDEHRSAIREFYEEQFRSTHRCPPGLTRSYDGCMPPGQTRKWKIGQPLPRKVATYDLPPEIIARIGPPPPEHRFVRVDGDILLIKTGTSLIVDVVEDLGR